MTAADNPEGEREPPQRPEGRPYRNVTDARSASILGLGMVVGAVIGAGVALLLAPGSGAETRHGIRSRARRFRRGGGPWSRLGRELQKAAAAKRKQIEMESKRREVSATREPV